MKKLDGLGLMVFFLYTAACDGIEKAFGFGVCAVVGAAAVALLAASVAAAKWARG